MALSARPIRYIVSGLSTPNRATTGRRPLTPHTTTQVRLFEQLLDKRTGALLALPQCTLRLPHERYEPLGTRLIGRILLGEKAEHDALFFVDAAQTKDNAYNKH